MKGFVFTYRLKLDTLKDLLRKYEGLIPNLSPTNLAKLNKALYMYDMENSVYSKLVEGLLIQIFKQGSD